MAHRRHTGLPDRLFSADSGRLVELVDHVPVRRKRQLRRRGRAGARRRSPSDPRAAAASRRSAAACTASRRGRRPLIAARAKGPGLPVRSSSALELAPRGFLRAQLLYASGLHALPVVAREDERVVVPGPAATRRDPPAAAPAAARCAADRSSGALISNVRSPTSRQRSPSASCGRSPARPGPRSASRPGRCSPRASPRSSPAPAAAPRPAPADATLRTSRAGLRAERSDSSGPLQDRAQHRQRLEHRHAAGAGRDPLGLKRVSASAISHSGSNAARAPDASGLGSAPAVPHAARIGEEALSPHDHPVARAARTHADAPRPAPRHAPAATPGWTAFIDRAAAPRHGTPHHPSCRRPGANPDRGPR